MNDKRNKPWIHFMNGALFCFVVMMAIAQAVTLDPRPDIKESNAWLSAAYSALAVALLWLSVYEARP